MWRNRLEVEVAIGLRGEAVGGFQWDVSDWDSGDGWGGIEPTFVVLENAAVESARIRRGRDSAKTAFSAATAEVRLAYVRTTGAEWTFRTSSPFQIGSELRLRGRVLDLAGAPVTDWLPLYRGTVRRTRDAFSPDDAFRVTLSLVGRMADLSVNLPERPVEGLGDTTDARLLRIMGLAGVDDYYARFDASVVEHQSSNFAQNLLSDAQKAVAGEGMGAVLYEDAEGFLRFRSQLWYDDVADTALTWTNRADAVPDPPAVVPEALDTGQDLDDVENYVSMSKAGGTAYTVEDTDSQLRYGQRTYQRYDLPNRYDADVEAEADYRLAEYATRTDRVDAIPLTVNPYAPADELAALLAIEIGDKHGIRWYDATDADEYLSGHLFVQGVQHAIDGEQWSVTVNLWAYAGYGIEAGSVWGTGVWGTSTWQ